MLYVRTALTLGLALSSLYILLPLLSRHAAGPSSVRQPDAQPARHTPTAPARPSGTMSSSSMRRAAPLVFPAASRHTATVIFVHGLGDSGAGWADAVAHWRARRRLDGVKFVLPHAPVMPITMNAGFRMPGWFDIKSLAEPASSLPPKTLDEDSGGILESRAYLHSLIQDEISAGIAGDRIVLGGFSQGGAMSILAGLTAPVKMAGIIGLSSWLLLSQTFKEHVPPSNLNEKTPIFMGHGDRDPLVRHALAQRSADELKKLGYQVTLRTYRGMEHSACTEELDEVEAFLVANLGGEST